MLSVVAAFAVSTAVAAPVDLVFDFREPYGPGNVEILNFNNFVLGDRGQLVFASTSQVPGGSQFDRVFAVRAPGDEPEVISFSSTSIDGQPFYISYFQGINNAGRAVTGEGAQVVASGLDATGPFVSVFGPSSPVAGLGGMIDAWADRPAFGWQRDDIAFALRVYEYNPYFEHVIRFVDGAARAVLSNGVEYTFDDGAFTPGTVGEFFAFTNNGEVIADVSRTDTFPDPAIRKFVVVSPDDQIRELFDSRDELMAANPGTFIDYAESAQFKAADNNAVVFASSLTGPGVDSSNDYGLVYFKEGDAQPRLLAQEGEPIAPGGDPITGIDYEVYMAPVTGEVYFSVGLPGNADSLFQPRKAFVYGDPDDLRVMETYAPVPGTTAIPTEIRYGNAAISPNGMLVLPVDAYDDPINQVGYQQILFAVDATGELRILAQSEGAAPGLDEPDLYARWDYFAYPVFGVNHKVDSCGRFVMNAAWRYFDGQGNHWSNDNGVVMFRLFHPDLDCNGLLDLADLVSFVTLFTASDPLADTDGNGLFDLADVINFATSFNN